MNKFEQDQNRLNLPGGPMMPWPAWMNSLYFLSQPSQNICARVSASQDQILADLLLTASKLKDSNTNCYSVYKHCHLADPSVCCSLILKTWIYQRLHTKHCDSPVHDLRWCCDPQLQELLGKTSSDDWILNIMKWNVRTRQTTLTKPKVWKSKSSTLTFHQMIFIITHRIKILLYINDT